MREYKILKLNELSIWSDNPRHFTENLTKDGVKEEDIINILIDIVGEGKMFNLITDIVASKGLMGNIFPIIVEKDGKYLVYDGNRRISSLKLLNNPDIAESELLKNKIKKLVESCDDLSFTTEVMVYITDENEALELMDKTHNGEQEGVGLIPWEAFQRDGSLVKRGQSAKYQISYKISSIMGYNKKSQFKIPYTDLNRLFGSKTLRDCFEIKDFTDKYKKQIAFAIQSLINYKQYKNFRSFSRHFNITDTSIDDSPIKNFCEWVNKQKENKNNITFDSNPIEIYKDQEYNFADHNLKLYDYNHKKVDFNIDELQLKYFNPNDEEVACVDTSEVGSWKVQITYNDHTYTEKIDIKKLLSPKIDFNMQDIHIKYGNTINLRDVILRATDCYGNDVKSQVIIEGVDAANIIGDIFDSNNTIGVYNIKFSFTNATGEPYSVTKNVVVVDGSAPIETTTTHTSLLSFNGKIDFIDITPEVNELILEINSLDYSEYKAILVVVLRTVIELTLDKLANEGIMHFSSPNDFEKKITDFKNYLDRNKIQDLCNKYPDILPSFHTENNVIQLIDPKEISAYLNLATHKSFQRIDTTKAIGLCKSSITPIIVYSSLLLKWGINNAC